MTALIVITVIVALVAGHAHANYRHGRASTAGS
jgi:hypothetical protein